MFQRPFATRFTCSTFLKCSHQVVIMKGSISWHYPKKSIHVQPLLMTEVEKILSSATACTPIFSIVLSGFQQWRHMHFLFHQLAHGNKFVPACSCSLKTSSSCSSRSKSDVSFLALLPPLGPPPFVHLNFVVHLLLLLQYTRKGQVVHHETKRSCSQNPNSSFTMAHSIQSSCFTASHWTIWGTETILQGHNEQTTHKTCLKKAK